MTFDELMGKILKICPNAIFGEEATGEITISTGFKVSMALIVDTLEEVAR